MIDRRAIHILVASLVAAAALGAPGVANAGRPKCAGKLATKIGTNKSETIKGTAKADVIVAKGGNDRIEGLAGNDRICGGGGNDDLIGGGGNDVLSGGAGVDHVDYAIATGPATINLTLGSASAGGLGEDKIVSVENAAGSSFDDQIVGNNAANYLVGGSGNDNLDGSDGGGDIVAGGAGDDTMNGGDGADDLASFAGSPDPIIAATFKPEVRGEGKDTIAGFEGFIGSDHIDNLDGDRGPNLFYGRGGNDSIDGGIGDDRLYGEGGDDFLYGNADNDFGDGGEGSDRCESIETPVSCERT